MLLAVAIILVLPSSLGQHGGYYTPQTYCFSREPDTSLNCATPYQTRSYDSERSCTDDCHGHQNCQVAVYQTQGGKCQLYQIAPYRFNPRGRRRKRAGYQGCGYRGPQTVSAGGYNYYQWAGKCPRQRATPTQPPTTQSPWSSWTHAPWTTWAPTTSPWVAWTPAPTPWAAWTPAPTTWAAWTPAPTTWAPWTPPSTTIRQRPTTTTTPPTLPAQVTCFDGESPRYLRIENYELVGSNDVTFTASNAQCIQSCSDNRTPTGQVTPCLSFEYSPGTQTCTMTLEAAEPTGAGLLAPAQGTTYYEKMCMPDQLVRSCDDVFDQIPQTILVGQAQGVTSEATYLDCIRTCLDAENVVGFRCLSGQFYYAVDAFNCVLNTESKDTLPGLMTTVEEDLVNYFDFRCGSAQPAILDDVARSAGRSLINLFDTNWSHWSTCNTKTQQKVRFRNCKTHSPSTCDHEENSC